MDSETPPPRAPALPAALPRLDLHSHGERPRVLANVVLSTTALQQGIRTHTCPQCGLNPTTTMVKRTFQYVPPWVYIGLLMNVIVLLLLYVVGRRVVKGEVALCADCNDADRRARTLQSVSVVGLVAIPLLFSFGAGLFLGAEAGLLAGAVGVVSGIVGMIAAHRTTRFDALRCVMVDKQANTTTLKASDTFSRVLLGEAPDALG